jgi:cation-dependent mannose-6-phosphate receptor
LGKSSDILQFADNRLLLEYELGATCGTSAARRRTKIYFTCGQDAGKGAPTYVAELDGCVYVFEWKTAYACTPEVSAHASECNTALTIRIELD